MRRGKGVFGVLGEVGRAEEKTEGVFLNEDCVLCFRLFELHQICFVFS